eukprot:298334_1
MVREILQIDVGQCGIQTGNVCWRNYCLEHGIDEEGNHYDPTNIEWRKVGPTKYANIKDYSFRCLFSETQNRKFVPKALMVDLEPNVIDDVKSSTMRKLYHPSFLL